MTMERLYFNDKKDRIICSYGANIYDLYQAMTEDSSSERVFVKDIVSVLKEKLGNDSNNPLKDVQYRSDVSEVYLFFDFDLQVRYRNRKVSRSELLSRLVKMVDFFDNETENGKLFINYPMVESIRYTKKLPDPKYNSYVVKTDELAVFKKSATEFSYYKNLDFICFKIGKRSKQITEDELNRYNELRGNWQMLINQNLNKACYLCFGGNMIPDNSVVIEQKRILDAQIQDYYPKGLVSVLNSFPLFLFDYFGIDVA